MAKDKEDARYCKDCVNYKDKICTEKGIFVARKNHCEEHYERK